MGDLTEVKRYREAEVTHGRVAMTAVLGFLVAESFHPLFGGNIGGPAIRHLDKVREVAPIFFDFLAFGIACAELYRSLVGWVNPTKLKEQNAEFLYKLNDDYYPGDVGFDPMGLKPTDPAEFAEMQTKELQNGRLAMLAAMGFLAQELVNHKPILETLKLLILLDDSEISKNLGINLPTGDIPTLELELETSAKDTFF